MFWKTCNKERTGVDKKSIKARVPAGTRSPFAGRRQVPSFPPAAILFFSPFWQDAATLTFAHTHTPATSTGCVVISERTSLWREGPIIAKFHPQQSLAACYNNEGAPAVAILNDWKQQSVPLHTLGLASSTLVTYSCDNFQRNFYKHYWFHSCAAPCSQSAALVSGTGKSTGVKKTKKKKRVRGYHPIMLHLYR